MELSEQTTTMLQTGLMTVVATLLVAKVSRECCADALRRRLGMFEAELFELARHGEIGFGDPAYAMLRHSIRCIVRHSHRISLTRFLADAVCRSCFTRSELVTNNLREWSEALANVKSDAARRQIAQFHERVLMEVGAHLALGLIPAARLRSKPGSLRSVLEGVRSLSMRNARIVEAQTRHFERMLTAN